MPLGTKINENYKIKQLAYSNLHFLSLTQVATGELVQNELQPLLKGSPCSQARGGRPHGCHQSTQVGGGTSISQFCTLVLQVIKNKTHNCPLVL